eukprot:475462-Amphidinium_carterae.1
MQRSELDSATHALPMLAEEDQVCKMDGTLKTMSFIVTQKRLPIPKCQSTTDHGRMLEIVSSGWDRFFKVERVNFQMDEHRACRIYSPSNRPPLVDLVDEIVIAISIAQGPYLLQGEGLCESIVTSLA